MATENLALPNFYSFLNAEISSSDEAMQISQSMTLQSMAQQLPMPHLMQAATLAVGVLTIHAHCAVGVVGDQNTETMSNLSAYRVATISSTITPSVKRERPKRRKVSAENYARFNAKYEKATADLQADPDRLRTELDELQEWDRLSVNSET